MKLVNRSALTLRPRQPYLDWINQLPSELTELEQPLAAGALDNEARVYLIGESEPEQSLAALLAPCWQLLLENELGAWDELGRHWPEPLSLELLTDWFEVSEQALVFDAQAEPLMLAEL